MTKSSARRVEASTMFRIEFTGCTRSGGGQRAAEGRRSRWSEGRTDSDTEGSPIGAIGSAVSLVHFWTVLSLHGCKRVRVVKATFRPSCSATEGRVEVTFVAVERGRKGTASKDCTKSRYGVLCKVRVKRGRKRNINTGRRKTGMKSVCRAVER